MQCNLCNTTAWKGPDCKKCKHYQEDHYSGGVGSDKQKANFFVIAEAPTISRISSKIDLHTPWSTEIEKTVGTIFNKAMKSSPKFGALSGRYTYAVRCENKKPTKKEIQACHELFKKEILDYAIPNEPIVVLALGPAVLQAFGLKVQGYKKLQGRVLKAVFYGYDVIIYATMSKRQLLGNLGFLDVIKDHAFKFLSIASSVHRKQDIQTETPLSQLTRNYVFPKTEHQLAKLTELIVTFAPPDSEATQAPLAIDTETNTLFPHREHTKILTLTVSWAAGYAASIPIEHPDSPFTLEQVRPYITRILTCDKPKIFFNAKYDLRILSGKGFIPTKLSWCGMVGEHLLEEDKKGFYTLKDITQRLIPEYSHYEDELLEVVDKIPKRKKPLEKLSSAAKKLYFDEGYEKVPLKPLSIYGAIDADVTRQIAVLQIDRMAEEQARINQKRKDTRTNPYYRNLVQTSLTGKLPLHDIMRDQMIPVIEVLTEMENTGIRVDREYIDSLALKIDTSLRKTRLAINGMIHSTMRRDFNPSSPAHLRKALFTIGYHHPETNKLIHYAGKIDIPTTATGLPSTNAKFLRSLVAQFDCLFSKEILNFRALEKARHTFIENVRVLSEEDGRMHTTFKPHGTVTGRLSSSNENMQNIPKKIGEHNLKKIFIPTDPATQLIVNADAKAAEVRIYAAYSKDANLIKALNDGMDPHSFFSSMALNPDVILQGVPLSERKAVLTTVGIDDEHSWSYEDFQMRGDFIGNTGDPGPDPKYGKQLNKMRTNIKRVVFGILYGAGKKKIAETIGIRDEQAQVLIDALFKMFPTIPEYIQRTKEQLHYMHMVETFFGRRRRFSNWNAMTSSMRNRSERQAINFKIQSTSSDIVMRTMVDMNEPIKRDFKGRVLITVHDSVVFEIPAQYASQMPDFIDKYGLQRVREQYSWLPVPFQWDIEVGTSYGELQDISAYLKAQGPNPISILDTEQEDIEFIEKEIREEFATA